MSLTDLLPESATADIVDAIRAAADTGNPQFLEIDLLSEDGVRRIYAEAVSDPDHQGEFVVTAREYSTTGSNESPKSREPVVRSRATESFAAAMAQTNDLEAVFREFSTVLASQLSYSRLSIMTVDHDRDEQHVLFSTDPDQDLVIQLSGTAVEIVSRMNEPLVVPAAIPSVIVVPLQSSGEVVAYLGIHSDARKSFSDLDLSIVTGYCPPVAAALAADRHRKIEERRAAEQDALRSISAITSEAGDLYTMLEVAADRLQRTGRFTCVRLDATTYARYETARPEVTATRGVAPPASQRPGDAFVDDTAEPLALETLVIGSADEAVGEISVKPIDATGLDQSDHDFLSECARRLSHGIARLRSDHELERLTMELDASREIERVTAGLSDLNTLVEMAAVELSRISKSESLTIRINRPDTEEIRHEYHIGDPSKHTADSPAVIPLLGPAGTIGEVSVSWTDAAETQTGLRRLEAMTPRLAERIHALLLAEASESSARDAGCLAEIEAAIERSGDPELALEESISILSNRLDGARISIAILEKGEDMLSELSVGGYPIDCWSAGSNRSVRGSLEGSAALATGPISSSNASPDALVARWPGEAMAVGAGIRSLASAELPTGDSVSAWLSVRSPHGSGFTDEDIDLLRRAAILIAGPVLRHRSEAHKPAEHEIGTEWATLTRIAHISQSTSGAEIPFARLAVELATVTEFDQIEIATVGSTRVIRGEDGVVGRRIYLGGKPVPGWDLESEFLLPGTVTEAVIRSRAGLLVNGESPSELAARFPAQAAALAAELRSFIAAPLIINDEAVGSIVLRSTDPFAYSQRDLATVEQVAVHVSSAIGRGRLQEQIERQRRESETLASIGSSWDLEPDVAAERAAVAFRRLVKCDGLVVTAVSTDADTVRVVASHGVDEVDKQFFAGRLDRLRSKSDSPPGSGGDKYASSLRARIGPMSRPLGYIHAYSSGANAFTADDEDLLQRVAEQLGSVFERVRAADHSTRLSAERGLRRKLDIQNRELKELTISRDRFLQTIVHELHTPLMNVQLFTDILMRNAASKLGEEEMSHIGLIADSGERLKELIENLLDVSQIQSDTFELAREEFDASPLIRDMCHSFSGVLSVHGQRIELSRPDEPLWITADPARFSSMLSNLISNACKYSDDGMAIRVQVDRVGSQLHVAISDQGMGISDEDQDRLFSPFERGTNPDVHRIPGTGLGLVIARSIARLHLGDLSLGDGTTARFYIEGLQEGPSEAYQARLAARSKNPVA
jgi:signal transduction histidine kinase